jgi:hypothetical protein
LGHHRPAIKSVTDYKRNHFISLGNVARLRSLFADKDGAIEHEASGDVATKIVPKRGAKPQFGLRQLTRVS